MENEKNIVCCFDCGTMIQIDEATEIGGEYFCEDCEDNYTECRECGKPHLVDDMNYDRYNEDYVCDSCYEYNNFSTCEDCGEIIEDAVGVDDYDKIVCEGCANSNYYQCDDCGGYFSGYNTRRDSSICVCDDCYDRNYYTCEDCGNIVHTDNVRFCGDESYCEYCYENNHASDIHQYSYKPSPIFHEVVNNVIKTSSCTSENTLYLGVELEVDDGDDINETVKEIHESMNWIYCKEDGSLDDGFELVSHPMTLDFVMNKKECYEDNFKYIVNNGFRSDMASTCGLHCHVNRDFFGDNTDTQDLHIAKIVLLVNNLWNDMVKFSRRTESQLNRWAKRYGLIDEVNKENEEAVIQCCKGQNNRYFAVNLQNRNTIEFRIFKGSLNVETFYATLQLVDNICRLVKEIDLKDVNSITMEDIITYDNYEELTSYSKRRGLL